VPKRPSHMQTLARGGAELRFRELVNELGNLAAAFPHLRDTISADELPISFVLAKGAQAEEKKRRARKPKPAPKKAAGAGTGEPAARRARKKSR